MNWFHQQGGQVALSARLIEHNSTGRHHMQRPRSINHCCLAADVWDGHVYIHLLRCTPIWQLKQLHHWLGRTIAYLEWRKTKDA